MKNKFTKINKEMIGKIVIKESDVNPIIILAFDENYYTFIDQHGDIENSLNDAFAVFTDYKQLYLEAIKNKEKVDKDTMDLFKAINYIDDTEDNKFEDNTLKLKNIFEAQKKLIEDLETEIQILKSEKSDNGKRYTIDEVFNNLNDNEEYEDVGKHKDELIVKLLKMVEHQHKNQLSQQNFADVLLCYFNVYPKVGKEFFYFIKNNNVTFYKAIKILYNLLYVKVEYNDNTKKFEEWYSKLVFAGF